MANTVIQLKNSGSYGNIPSTLSPGELAINHADGKLFYGTALGDVVEFNPSSVAGLNSEVQFNDYGALGASSYFTYDKLLKKLTVDTIKAHSINVASSYTLPSSDGGVNQYITTDGNGNLSWTSLSSEVSIYNYTKYLYANISTPTYIISGLDDNNNSLHYELNKLDVFVNGICLTQGFDYTATTGSDITLSSSVSTSDIVEIASYASSYTTDTSADIIRNISSSLSNTSPNQSVDTFNASTYSTCKYICQIKSNTDIQATEILLMHDNTYVYINEFGTMYSANNLGTFTSDISSGNVRLLFSPVYSNTSIKLKRVSVSI